MQLSNVPAKIQVPFASTGAKRTIPIPSQIGITPGAASYTDGFPPLTMQAIAAGGIPPAGQDFNGLFNATTLIQQWQSAGGSFAYDATWSTANNGYPKGAVLSRADGTGFWFNTTDNNTADPDGATPTGWVPEWQYGITAITGLTNANVTLSSLQYGRPIITLAGTLTGNVQIIFPTVLEQWLIVNNTTGAFSVTAKTAAGTGQVIPQGGQTQVWGDGTNLNSAASGAGRLLNVRVITSTQTYTPTAGTRSVFVRLIGGGGAGGSAAATGGAQCSGGAGGGAGGYAESYLTSGFSGVTVTIGAGGAAATGGGNPGGASSFGGLISCTGGSAGTTNAAGSNSVTTPNGQGNGGTASGGNLANGLGASGLYSLYGSTVLGGVGAASPFGGGPAFASGTAAGNTAASPGTGGGGACALAGQATNIQGGSGAAGLCEIWEFS